MATEITQKHAQVAATDFLHHIDGAAEPFAYAILQYVGKAAILDAIEDVCIEMGWEDFDVENISDEEWKRMFSDWGAGL